MVTKPQVRLEAGLFAQLMSKTLISKRYEATFLTSSKGADDTRRRQLPEAGVLAEEEEGGEDDGSDAGAEWDECSTLSDRDKYRTTSDPLSYQLLSKQVQWSIFGTFSLSLDANLQPGFVGLPCQVTSDIKPMLGLGVFVDGELWELMR